MLVLESDTMLVIGFESPVPIHTLQSEDDSIRVILQYKVAGRFYNALLSAISLP
jgi:hypothetical protein